MPAGNCFKIQPSTTTLTDFVGYSMLVDPASNILDTPTLDSFLRARFDNNTGYIGGFRSFFDCPTWNGSQQRFHLSFYEGELIFLAQNNPTPCPVPTSVPNIQLCQSTCNLAQSALSSIFTNPQFCNQNASPTVQTNRQSTLDSYGRICQALPTTSNCLQSVALERNSCGFLMRQDAVAYCGTGGQGQTTNDPCCQIFLGNGGTAGITTMGAGAPLGNTNGNLPNTGLGTAGAGGQSMTGVAGTASNTQQIANGPANSGSGKTATTIAIVVGFLGGLTIIIGLYMFIAYRNKRVQAGKDAETGARSGNAAAAIAAIKNSGGPLYQNRSGNTKANGGAATLARGRADRSGSAELMNTNAAPFANDGLEDFDYEPVGEGNLDATPKSVRYSWMKEGLLGTISAGEVGGAGGVRSYYSEAPSTRQSMQNAPVQGRFQSIYSDAARSSAIGGTMESSRQRDFQEKKSQYSSYVSDYSESEYRPVSYALPNNELQMQGNDVDGGEVNLSYTENEDEGMFKVKVLFQYEKDMGDELSLKPGEIVTVTNLFDDGWANGFIGSRRGAFPLACVVPLGEEGTPSVVSDSTRLSVLKRRSSLGSNQLNFR
ncbi:hypothetical protein BC830DRAFT_1109683 [Chytriomyces sp. MP71]|nr:hypothetical protein BC830DRAFT_1109683 [Chytriomyces sp. MP71]